MKRHGRETRTQPRTIIIRVFNPNSTVSLSHRFECATTELNTTENGASGELKPGSSKSKPVEGAGVQATRLQCSSPTDFQFGRRSYHGYVCPTSRLPGDAKRSHGIPTIYGYWIRASSRSRGFQLGILGRFASSEGRGVSRLIVCHTTPCNLGLPSVKTGSLLLNCSL